MGICWYCHWGWADEVASIYERSATAIDAIDGELAHEHALHFGPAHIVWEDENFDAHSIEYCLKACGDGASARYDVSPGAIAIVRQSLLELLALPQSVREPVPPDYDDENPEIFPPADGVTTRKPGDQQ